MKSNARRHQNKYTYTITFYFKTFVRSDISLLTSKYMLFCSKNHQHTPTKLPNRTYSTERRIWFFTFLL